MRYLILLFTLLMACIQAGAQVYKCTDEKGRITYSDASCPFKSGKVIANTPQSLPSRPNESSISRQLDTAVRRSIANNDLNHAENLAVTPEHFEWIAAAKKDNQQRPVLGRTEADLSIEKGGSYECERARRSYEFEAGAYKQVQNLIDAKRSMMHSACGIKEPTQIKIDNKVIVNQRFR